MPEPMHNNRVGDTVKFGQSSRLFLLCGPDELLPEEGLTRSQKAQLAQMEYAQRMKERDLKVRSLGRRWMGDRW